VKNTKYIWMNGQIIPWEEAKIHVLSHVVHYGSSWFEGIRCYETSNGSAVFKLNDHIDRLFKSTKIYRTEIPYSVDDLSKAILDIIKANNLKSCYIRPVVFRGFFELGVYPLRCPIDTVIAVWEWGSYLGQDSLEKGIDVMTSTWRRFSGNSLPPMAKAGGHYMNAQLVKMEAIENGYAEGVVLDNHGNIAEGSGENIFLVQRGVLYTPPLSSGILSGITRSVVLHLAKNESLDIREEVIPREFIYTADEVFLTGTAAEITPVRSVDRIQIGNGKPGPVTRLIQSRFFDITRNGNDPFGWLTWL
jgi:branched-chain amino acid aminotransferase